MPVRNRSRRSLTGLAVMALILAILPVVPAAAAACPDGSTQWDVDAGGTWELSSNWRLGVPDETKDVCIDVPGTYTITVTGISNSAKSITILNPNATVLLSGNSSVGDAVLTVANGVDNAGVIELTAAANSWAGELRVTGGTLVNSGTIRTGVGAGTGNDARVIAAPSITNSGTLDLGFTTKVLTGATGLANTGRIEIADAVGLTVDDLSGSQPSVTNTTGIIVNAGTWTHLGGVLDLAGGIAAVAGGLFGSLSDGDLILGDVELSGGPTFELRGVDLTLAGTTDRATFEFASPFNTLTGNVATDQTMRLSGNSSHGDAVVTAADALTNAGVIELTSAANSWAGELRVTSGTLVNSGTIRTGVGAGTGNDARVIAAPTITNSGTLDLDFTTKVQTSGATLANTGVVDIADGVTVDVVGAYSQSAGGRLAVGLSSASNGVLDVDSGSLAGAIEAVVDPADLPADGVDYTVVTSGSRSGVFSDLDGSDLGDGRVLVMHHQPTSVILSTAEANQPNQPPVVAAVADVSVVKSAAADSVAIGALLDFTLAVSNEGPDAAAAVVVTDELPAGLVFSAGSDGCSAVGQTVTCQIGTVATGGSADATVTVVATQAGAVTNTATVSTSTTDEDPTNDASSVSVSVTVPDEPTERVFGVSRIETAVSASRSTYADGAAGAVVLARADTFPDALAGAPLAVANQAPLLLTGSGELHPLAEQELLRVLPTGGTVHLLGGQVALSDAVADRVEQLGFVTARYAGTDRYETAVLIARGLPEPRAIFVATGANFPDALASGAAAAETGGAIVLTNDGQMVDATAQFLAEHPGVPRYAVGGPAAIADPAATPVFGADRFATALKVAQTFFDAPAVVGVAVGTNFPDALAGGTHVARRRAPMLLVGTHALPEPVGEYLTSNRGSIGQVFVYGGDSAISTDVEQALLTALQ